MLELDQELEIASRTTNSFTESLRIFSRRVAGGTASALEAARAEAALADASAAIPAILDQISSAENQLCLLLGRTPGPIERSASSVVEMMPPSVPAGLPSSLVERRPDVREAEQLLRSASAQIGESVAEFFPRIGLTTLLGKVSPELSAFTLGSASEIVIKWRSNGLQGVQDESWGIDNVTVSVNPTPTPGTFALLGLGGAILGFRPRRK